jgi:hypothetical protein
MLILPKQESIIITPPKTGSNTLHLEGIPGAIWVYGFAGHDTSSITQHTTLIPNAMYADFKVYLTVRNPYQRAYSLYKHQVKYQHYKGTFHDWIIHCLKWPDNFFFQPCAWFADNTFHLIAGKRIRCQVTNFLKLESLQSQLEEKIGLTFDHELVRRHPNGEDKASFTDLEKHLIGRWAKDDFGRYQYPRM